MADDTRDLNRNEDERTNDYREETAAEVVPLTGTTWDRVNDRREEREENIERNEVEDREEVGGRGLGVFSIIASIASLFFLPVILGATGIILGFFAVGRGARTSGWWGIGIGIASIVISLLFAPFF
ncbi:hypothetical protein [Fictibacillus gelatini]|uniref:hypothetical protein n=1 Tax=Fictibacillus gelatini TaxID=225985 RepID=UPI00041DD6E6|nr:hypothetical protein [Fictibacillus gelatini]